MLHGGNCCGRAQRRKGREENAKKRERGGKDAMDPQMATTLEVEV